MENEQHLNPNESLALISEVINKTKENIREQSFIYLLWGWVIALASFSSFLLLSCTSFTLYFLPFPVFSVLAVMAHLAFYARQKRTNTQTYLAHFLSKMWLVIGGSFFLIAFVSVSQHIPPFSYTIILCGIGTLISGLLMNYKPLSAGVFLFFIFAIISAYVTIEYKILLQGIAIILGNLIPGYMLKRSK